MDTDIAGFVGIAALMVGLFAWLRADMHRHTERIEARGNERMDRLEASVGERIDQSEARMIERIDRMAERIGSVRSAHGRAHGPPGAGRASCASAWRG